MPRDRRSWTSRRPTGGPRDAAALAEDGPDFWLFDDGFPGACAVLMHYHDDGRLDRRELVTDPDQVDRLASIVHAADERAVPLNEFLASSAVSG